MGALSNLEHGGDDRFVSWAVVSRSIPGEADLGDRFIAQRFPGGMLLGAVDGLGHGLEAAQVAETAVQVLRSDPQESVDQLVQRCHEILAGTRGVVLTLASVSEAEQTLTWLGVGNVNGVVIHADLTGTVTSPECLIAAPGVVGYTLPRLNTTRIALRPDDLIVFATDGVRPGFEQGLRPLGPPSAIAERIMTSGNKGTDDALVLVARYAGGEP